MPLQDGLWQMAGGDVVFAQLGNAGPAVVRAREILRHDGDLTLEQFHELDGLLRIVSHPQFTALTEDPLHHIRLRQYEALSWQQSNPSVLVPVLLLAIAALIGFIIMAA